jgi:NADH dehydrogenase
MLSAMPRVVIIGAGFGGLHVALGLKNVSASVTLIDKNNHHLFQPLLYQIATAGLSPADIAAPIRSLLRHQANTEVLMEEVLGLDLHSKNVLTARSSIPFDHLVIASGSSHSYFGHEEWAKCAPGLKTIVDATSIRRKILLAFEHAEAEENPKLRKSLLTFICVGGGPTGVEMVGSIAELAHHALKKDFRRIRPEQAKILLIEAGPRLLSSFPESLALIATRKLNKLGVETRVNARVEKIDDSGIVVADQRIDARTVIWTAGVKASNAGHWLGASMDKAGRVKILPNLTVPGHPYIQVLGDTATLDGKNGRPLPGLAPVAIQQGIYAARAIRAQIEGKAPLSSFQYLDKGNLATIGRGSAIADIHGFLLHGRVAWFVWALVHIRYLVTFRNRLLVLVQWSWAYLTFQRGARLITEVAPDSMVASTRFK